MEFMIDTGLTMDIMESYGVLVGRTLVDASDWSASVLLINLGSDMVVLPSFSVSAVSVARTVVVARRLTGPFRNTSRTFFCHRFSRYSTNGARHVRCGPRRLNRPVLRKCLQGDRLSLVIVPGLHQ